MNNVLRAILLCRLVLIALRLARAEERRLTVRGAEILLDGEGQRSALLERSHLRGRDV